MMALADDLSVEVSNLCNEKASVIKSINVCSSDEFVKTPIRSFRPAEACHSPPATLLYEYHVAIICTANTLFALIIKTFPLFIIAIASHYSLSCAFVSRSLAIASSSTIVSSIVVLPRLLSCTANACSFLICAVGCIATSLLLHFPDNEALVVVGICLLYNALWLYWNTSNAIISTFVHRLEVHVHQKYQAWMSVTWLCAAFLPIPVGYTLELASFERILLVLMILFGLLAITSLLLLPIHSIRAFNETYYSSQRDVGCLALVCGNARHLYVSRNLNWIFVLLLLSVASWSMIYTSFGYWIGNLYHLQAAELGLSAALIEGTGAVFAAVSIAYTSFQCNINIKGISIYFTLISFFCVGALAMIYNVSELHSLVTYKIVVYILAGMFFYASEGNIVALVKLAISEVAPSQHIATSTIISVVVAAGIATGQYATGRIVFDDANTWGFNTLVLVSLCVQATLVFGTIYTSHRIKHNRLLVSELIHLNTSSNSIEQSPSSLYMYT